MIKFVNRRDYRKRSVRRFKKSRNVRRGAIQILFLCMMVTACGKQSDADTSVKERAGTLETEEIETGEIETEAASQNTEVVTVHTTEGTAYVDTQVPVQYTDDLSLLEQMGQTDGSYAYQEGSVYYRQYHEDSFEESALWAYYQPIAGTEKEIVCMDADGEKTVLFPDKGYGSLYLIGDRFYMTEMIERERADSSSFHSEVVYSVDMRGQNRIDHGYGEICAVDLDRNVLILELQLDNSWKKAYGVLDCASGELRMLTMDTYDSLTFWDYCDGWCYFDAYQERDDKISRVVAVSLDGKQKEIIALTSENAAYDMYYREYICEIKVVRDRLYIVFGGYDGSAKIFQGGWLIAVHLDGSDYQAIEMNLWEGYNDVAFLVCYDADRPLVYFPRHYMVGDQDYFTGVWDVEANTISPSDFPVQMLSEQRTHSVLPYQEHLAARSMCVLWGEEANVYALPDDSGRVVQVARQIDANIVQSVEGEFDYTEYKHLYYADGFLYFEAEFNSYDEESSIGWRDGYRRVQTDVYRLKLDENAIELLYSY